MTHYSYGSGMAGCLYDFGPHFAETLAAAREQLEWLFDDYFTEHPEELEKFRTAFGKDGGVFYFEHPAEAGAQIAEVVPQPGPMPEEES